MTDPVRLGHRLEYGLARACLALVDHVPVRCSLALARGVGDVTYAALRARRRIAIENVLRAGVASERTEAARIARASFRHFAMLAVEVLHASRCITPERLDEFAEVHFPAATERLLDQRDQGIVLVGSHLGNWEVAGHIASFRKPVTAVARRLNNPLVDRLFERRNSRRNIEILSKHSADPRGLIRALRQGRMLGLIVDQHASRRGMSVPFFGIPAQTVVSPARLHLATRCPILCACGVRTGTMRFRLESSEPLCFEGGGDRTAAVYEILLELNRRIEGFIRRHPEQYLWSHRRWRTPQV